MSRRAISGSRFLVTGASSGIGWHLALQLATRGGRVLATARRHERLLQLQQVQRDQQTASPTGELEILAGDITSFEHRQQLIRRVLELWDGFDVLVNNAGVGAIGSFAASRPNRLRTVMDVDFFSAVELTRIGIPVLRRGSRPAIVLVSSVLAHRAVPFKSEYCAAKFALRGWSEAVRLELRPMGIDVIVVSPSTTASEFFDHLIETPENEKSYSLGSMSAERVAQHIVRSIERGSRETILTAGGKLLVCAARLFPKSVDRVLSRLHRSSEATIVQPGHPGE